MRLKSITFDSTDEQLVIETTEVKAKSFTGAERKFKGKDVVAMVKICLLYTSPSPRDGLLSRMPSSA